MRSETPELASKIEPFRPSNSFREYDTKDYSKELIVLSTKNHSQCLARGVRSGSSDGWFARRRNQKDVLDHPLYWARIHSYL
jgi:hypothetical protein